MIYSGSVDLEPSEVVNRLVEHLELAHEAYELLDLLKLHGGLKELEDQVIQDKQALLKNKKLRLTDEARAKLERQVKHAQDDLLREETINDWGGLAANWRAFKDKQERYTTSRPDSLLEELRDSSEVVSLLKSAFDSLSYDCKFMDRLRDNDETVLLWNQLHQWRGRV